MAKTKQVVKGKIIKKEWYHIRATKAFDSTPLGESYVADPQTLLHRKLTINLANLTGDIKQQGINLKFQVISVQDNAGIAQVIGYEASPSQLKRLVRKGVERLDDTIPVETSDGKKVILKPFIVTRVRASNAKLHLMRRLLRQTLLAEIKEMTFDNLIRSVISNNIQGSLKKPLRKVFPLKALEIRRLDLVPEEKSEDEGEETKSKEKTEATEEKVSKPGKEEKVVEESSEKIEAEATEEKTDEPEVKEEKAEKPEIKEKPTEKLVEAVSKEPVKKAE